MPNEHTVTFVLEHYKARRERHVSQGNRLWTRFHYFLTIDAGLVGAYILKIDTLEMSAVILVIALGVFWSLLWFLIGAQDLFFYHGYREALRAFEEDHILPGIGNSVTPIHEHIAKVRRTILRFKIKRIGVTSFSSICPLLFLGTWIVLVGWAMFFRT